jgi:hypothetical protein
MSFRIKTHTTTPSTVTPQVQPKKEEEKVVPAPELPKVPRARQFRYNELPVEKLLPAQERKAYIKTLRTSAPETIIEKDVIVYDKYKEEWILVKESEAYKYKGFEANSD